MRRAKKPPTPEQRALAGVVADALTLERRADVVEDLKALLPVAIAEFVRVFVTYNTNDRLWVVKHDRIDDSTDWSGTVQYEVQYCCFFCRESLVTLPQRQKLTTKLDSRLNRHAEQCGMMFLAGLTSGSDTLTKRPEVQKADRQRAARDKKKWVAAQLKIEQATERRERYRRLGLTDA